jgi:outer membrane protein OmpA-like peptidoglycan-associated protein
MTTRERRLALFVAAFAVAVPALAEEVKREGVIISSGQNGLNVRTREGPLTVIVTPTTKIRESKGLSKKTREPATLIPGLIIQVEGDQQGDTVTAEEIEFKERDWRSAIATKAGTTEQVERATAEREELRRAIVEGQEYVIREETTVYFATGSASIASQYQQQLRQLAQKAASHGNYRVSILGFADQRGNAEANERLSLRRAMAVSNYLRQTGLVQPGRVLSPSAMGEGTVAPEEAAPSSDNQARRVVVRIVTPKTQLQQ